jgi:glycosyltransferase involved in cell wall biosynthesis
MTLLTVVIPCFNESQNIPSLVECITVAYRHYSAINANPPSLRFLLVDNGSSDNSLELIRDTTDRHQYIDYITLTRNDGYGAGIKAGLRSSLSSEFIGWTHADLQTPIEDILKAYQVLVENKYLPILAVKGIRNGRPLTDRIFSMGMGLTESLYLGQLLWDINAQPNIYPTSFIKRHLAAAPSDFSLDLYYYYLAKKSQLKIYRQPVLFPPRLYGTSSWNTGLASKFKFIKRTLSFSLKLKQCIKAVQCNNRDSYYNEAHSKTLPYIIQHRVNSITTLKATPNFYGIEIDVRSNTDNLYLAHDPFTDGPSLSDFLNSFDHSFLIINVKEDGLESRILELLDIHSITSYFILDQPLPSLIRYLSEGNRNCAYRISEYEPPLSLPTLPQSPEWLWIDHFSSLPISPKESAALRAQGFKLCIVSPELQGYSYQYSLDFINKLHISSFKYDAVCTKFPTLWHQSNSNE